MAIDVCPNAIPLDTLQVKNLSFYFIDNGFKTPFKMVYIERLTLIKA